MDPRVREDDEIKPASSMTMGIDYCDPTLCGLHYDLKLRDLLCMQPMSEI